MDTLCYLIIIISKNIFGFKTFYQALKDVNIDAKLLCSNQVHMVVKLNNTKAAAELTSLFY